MPLRVPPLIAAALVAGSMTYGAPPPPPAPPSASKPNPPPTTRPTTAPTTQPAVGPKDVLKQLASAMRRGEADEIRGVLYAANETEQRMARATADYAAALAALQKAAVAAFGEQGAKELTGDAPPGEEIARIDAATLAIDGDTATVTFVPDKAPETPAQPTNSKGESDPPPPPPEPVVLKRVSGRWRVPVASLSKGATPEEIEQRLADLSAQTGLIREIAQEIAAGRYKSAEQAGQAWRLKVYALTPKPGGAPASQPSTKPANPAENPNTEKRNPKQIPNPKSE